MKQEMLDKYILALASSKPQQYIDIAEAFLQWLGTRAFTKDMVLLYCDYLKKYKYYADGTVIRHFKVIRRLAKVNGVTLDFRRDELPQQNELELYAPAMDPVDIKAMVDLARGLEPAAGGQAYDRRPEHAAFLALSTVYGLRRAEMALMVPGLFDIKNRTMFVETVKEGRQRYHIISDNIAPWLSAWGFQRQYSEDALTDMFGYLKRMIGFEAREVGWHAIRRSAIAEAWRCGLTEPDILSFYRWKRPMGNMPLRYATAKIVGRAGERVDVSFGDRQVDKKVLQLHPFVRFWD